MSRLYTGYRPTRLSHTAPGGADDFAELNELIRLAVERSNHHPMERMCDPVRLRFDREGTDRPTQHRAIVLRQPVVKRVA